MKEQPTLSVGCKRYAMKEGTTASTARNRMLSRYGALSQ